MQYYNKKEFIVHFGFTKWKNELSKRKKQAKIVELFTKDSKPFWYVISPDLLQQISFIEKQRGILSATELPRSFVKTITKKARYYEAYYSSHIEGARTSLEEALLSLKSSAVKYKDESKQMIVNNKLALDLLDGLKYQDINHETIYTLHKALMVNTHKETPIPIGKYRHSPVYVVNSIGQIIYEAPEAKHVVSMMTQLLEWLRNDQETHPLIKASISHLYFVHIHPFADGNGRTARLLANLVLENHGYDFINMLSPSHYYDDNRPQYYKAIRNVEIHDFDLTYFVIFTLNAIINQFHLLETEIKKQAKVNTIKDQLEKDKFNKLNKRQVKTLNYMLQTEQGITTKKYCKMNKCSDETARIDFNTLIELKIVKKQGKGRSTKYYLL